ncbi:hypothetical protein BDB01DRAFT_850420 [Pilobolus umbonatus]|nr:hypothetical protein BDB01DRAFT_850420 [Pilobolus umbonatus]
MDRETDSILYTESITEEFYRACQVYVEDRSGRDSLIIKGFVIYLKRVLMEYMADNKVLCGTIHHVLTVPDNWSSHYFESIRQTLIEIGLLNNTQFSLDIIHTSNALITHLQHTVTDYSLNKGNYVFCWFKNHDASIMDCEIGNPIKGLDSILQHSLSSTRKITYHRRETFEERLNTHLIKILISSSSREARGYITKINDLIKLCIMELNTGQNANITLLELIHKYSDDPKKYIIDNPQKQRVNILESVKLKDIIDDFDDLPFYSIYSQIQKYSRKHPNPQIIVIVQDRFGQNNHIKEFTDSLSSGAVYHIEQGDQDDIILRGSFYAQKNKLQLLSHIPSIMKNKSAQMTLAKDSAINTVYIDIGKDKNSVTYLKRNNEGTMDNTLCTLDYCPPFSQCFEVHTQSDTHTIYITQEWIHLIETYFKDSSPKLFRIKKVSHSKKRVNGHIKKNSRHQFVDLVKKVIHLQDNHTLQSEKAITTEDVLKWLSVSSIESNQQKSASKSYLKRLFKMYIDFIQWSASQSLISNKFIDPLTKYQVYITVDQYILDLFFIDFEGLRAEMIHTNRHNRPIKLIKREQVSAVYCKNKIRCHEHVQDYLDYPQSMVQIQMHPTYINLASNVILPLRENVDHVTDETVLTLERSVINFNFIDTLVDSMWVYIQLIRESQINYCNKHNKNGLGSDRITHSDFVDYFHDFFMIKFLLQNTSSKVEWDRIRRIKLNKTCSCNISLVTKDVLDICLTPSIQKLIRITKQFMQSSHLTLNNKLHYLLIMDNPFQMSESTPYFTEIMTRIKEGFHDTEEYENTAIQWLEDDISVIMNQGMESIIHCPEGGTLEQVSGRSYSVKLECSLSKTGTLYPIIKKGSPVTEHIRLNGYCLSLDSYQSIQEDAKKLVIYSVLSKGKMEEVASFDLKDSDASLHSTLKIHPGLSTMSASVVYGTQSTTISISDHLTLSFF